MTATRTSLLALLCAGVANAAPTSTLRLEFEPKLPASPQVSRLDLVLSQLELQRADGSWLPTADWTAFVSCTQHRLQADATGLPSGDYQAVRFVVGLPTETNALSPDAFGSEHPLRAAIDTMHWGWQGGFIFMAVEGRSAHGAFSYHLATDACCTRVTLPIKFTADGPLTLRIGLDAGQILAGIDFATAAQATHSRPGDALPALLQAGLQKGFEIKGQTRELHRYLSVPSSSKPAEVQLRVPERFPAAQLPADNPLTKAGIALGAQLFMDKRLSSNGSQSCASCHDRRAAFADSRRYSVGADGTMGTRNAMPLFNLAWHGAMFWDGRAKSLREQVLMPISNPDEMGHTMPKVLALLNADAAYCAQFRAAFGTEQITSEHLAKAIEQHLLTLTSFDSKFDRALRKEDTLSESEQRGLQLFVTEHDPVRGLRGADCFHCHGGMTFSDHSFHNNGLRLSSIDLGREAVTQSAADRGKFKAPSLRNIALTAPYMHDGRFASLEQVVEHYSSGVQRSDTLDPNLAKHPNTGLQLTATEKADLIAFLHTLTDEAITLPTLTHAYQR